MRKYTRGVFSLNWDVQGGSLLKLRNWLDGIKLGCGMVDFLVLLLLGVSCVCRPSQIV